MKRQVLPHPDVRKALSSYVTVQLEGRRGNAAAGRYGVIGTPTFIVLTPDGMLLESVAGYVPPAPFTRFLQLACAKAAPAAG